MLLAWHYVNHQLTILTREGEMITVEKLAEMLKGKNHAEIAAKVGVTRSYINQIANGGRVNPSLQLANKILKAVEGSE